MTFHEFKLIFIPLFIIAFVIYRTFSKKSNDPKYKAWLYKKDVPYFIDPKTKIQYHHPKSRYYFHKELHDLNFSFDNSFSLNAITLCDREQDRIVGAYMVFDSDKLRDNKSLNIERNDALRSYITIPGRELVKDMYTVINGKRYYHYHATHLIPFRLCLNDGHYGDIMFMGTANLNSGTRPEYGWKPSDRIVANRVKWIINVINSNPRDRKNNVKEWFRIPRTSALADDEIYTGEELPPNNMFSLDDFERVIDEYVRMKRVNIVWKYGVECFYNDDNSSTIPDYIEIVFSNLTSGENIFVARVDNV